VSRMDWNKLISVQKQMRSERDVDTRVRDLGGSTDT
jgi:hypothetical protein